MSDESYMVSLALTPEEHIAYNLEHFGDRCQICGHLGLFHVVNFHCCEFVYCLVADCTCDGEKA